MVDSSYSFSEKKLQYDSGTLVSWNISITAKQRNHFHRLRRNFPFLKQAMPFSQQLENFLTLKKKENMQ